METEKKELITRKTVDAMSEEELLAFLRRHSQLLGERFRVVNFWAPTVLDEPYLVRSLDRRLGRERFVELVREQNKREYIAGGRWAAALLSQGGTIPAEVLQRQEQKMGQTLTEVREQTHSNGRGYEWNEVHEYIQPLSVESSLFLEVSEKARQIWAGQYDRYYYQSTRCDHLAQVMALRRKWLGASHLDSAQMFYRLGWKPLDVMLTYLLGEASDYIPGIDPDCAIDAARRDPETAVRLLDQDCYKQYLEDRFHPSYYAEMAQIWREVLYLQYRWPDLAPLEKGHRLKKADAHCRLTLERLGNPGWPRRDFEQELKQAGLLVSETPLDWDSPKLAKRQRLTLTRAMTCHYQWRAADLLAALAASPRPELFTALVWGIYREDKLEAGFLLDKDGAAWGEDGEPLALPGDAPVGLAVPAELSKQQLALWKKRLKEAGGRPPIRQLALPAQPPELDRFEGTVTRHITIYTVSGKWGLDMGPLPVHCRADLRDPLHGYGARITFEKIWNGPEYNEDEVMVYGVDFYRMDSLPFGDCLPRRAAVPPEELPARFVSLAGAAFKQLAGLK